MLIVAWHHDPVAPRFRVVSQNSDLMQHAPTTPSDESYAAVLSEWQALAAARPVDVQAWVVTLGCMREEQESLRASGAWVHGRSDIFGVAGIQRAEIRHSALIAWLLDPCGRHGLGTRFLSAFLGRAWPGEEFERLTTARTTCEVTRGECRADIVVNLPELTVIIENKVDAPESPQQCDILFDEFGDEPSPRFILLTPTGHAPQSASADAATAFVPISYPNVIAILEGVLAASTTERPADGRHVAEDYLRTLKREFR